MAYGWQILLNSVDISNKVSGFSIACSLDSYCREMTLDIADSDLYASLDFTQISESPEIEILTKNGTSFVSQGMFFIERPALASTTRSDLMTGVWGRSLTALLAEPFAVKVTKTWTTQTTFFGVCEEMCDLVGLAWDPDYSDTDDFVIYPSTYEVEGVYPIDVITELAGFAGAKVTTDRLGHLCIKQVDYAPTTADVTITDDDIAEITESPEWPTFGNRISITPTGTQGSYSVTVTVADECLSADGVSKSAIYAQVKDSEGNPINNQVVSWTKNSAYASLSSSKSNTKRILIKNEKQQAATFHSVVVASEPSSVVGVWAASDTGRRSNLAAGGYTTDDNTITLTNKLSYCNQTLVVTYYSDGIAVNYLTAGSTADDVTITADVEGQEGAAIVYIDNPCQCPPSIALTAAPSSIEKGGTSQLIVYVEESGPVTAGRYVYMSIIATKRGALSWTSARLGTVSIKNEDTIAIDNIAGLTQCEISMYPKSVSSVRRADEDGAAYGSNLYSSHEGKTIALSTDLDAGTALLVNYIAQGAALNTFTGTLLGKCKIMAWIASTREEGANASIEISIEDNTVPADDYPSELDDDQDGGYGDVGGDDSTYDPASDGSATGPDDEDITDSDNDGMDDAWEIDNFGDLSQDGTGDYDEDGLTDLEEYEKGTDPTNPDTDEDELTDLEEIARGTDPNDPDDPDKDKLCMTNSVSSDPSPAALAGRFATALEYDDCDCETLCTGEISTYGTTQNYDGASGRTISKIVVQDYDLTLGTPEFWEKYAEIKQAAIDACWEQCDECHNAETFALDDENTADTIVAGGSIGIYVTGGVAPYTFETSSLGYTINGVQSYTTDGQSATLICASGACVTDYAVVAIVTITDACGSEVTAEIRNTAGTWVLIDECGGWEGTGIFEFIIGQYKYLDDWCGYYEEGTTCEESCVGGPCEAHGTPGPVPEGQTRCYVEGSKTYQWQCGT